MIPLIVPSRLHKGRRRQKNPRASAISFPESMIYGESAAHYLLLSAATDNGFAAAARIGQISSRLWMGSDCSDAANAGRESSRRAHHRNRGSRRAAGFESQLGFNPRRQLHEQLHLSLSTIPNSKLLHTRAIEWLKQWLAYPDTTKGWIPFASKAVAEFAKQERIDAILTTSPPQSCHIIGAQAKKILGCPWIADFRDLWTQNLGEQKHSSQPLRVRLEKKTLAGADVLVTVSEPWARRLRERYSAKPIYTVANGFDPDDFRQRPSELTKSFSITYAGVFYNGKRDPRLLFEVLRELIQEQIFLPRKCACASMAGSNPGYRHWLLDMEWPK